MCARRNADVDDRRYHREPRREDAYDRGGKGYGYGGGYEGKGGYGKVFQVRCNLNDMIYAMKVVDKASIERHRSMDNIAIELQVLRQHAEVRAIPLPIPWALRHVPRHPRISPPHIPHHTSQVRHPFILGLE